MYLKTISFFSVACALAWSPAAAEDFSYADRHGNLVIESDAGYKRILVGEAARAEELSDYLYRAEGYAEDLGATRVFPDSQGNLIIRAASGYKQILVGRADEAGKVARVIQADREAGHGPGGDVYSEDEAYRWVVVCTGADGVVKGRSYMYGLDRNEMPVFLTCE